MKKISVKLAFKHRFNLYVIVQLTNAGTVAFNNRTLSIGDEIEAKDVDAFARDKRWDVSIVQASNK